MAPERRESRFTVTIRRHDPVKDSWELGPWHVEVWDSAATLIRGDTILKQGALTRKGAERAARKRIAAILLSEQSEEKIHVA